MKDELKEILTIMVELIGYEGAVITEEPGEEREEEGSEYTNLKVEIENPGPLIGNEGETLASLEFMVNLIYYKRHEEWPKLRVNINDYLERQQDKFVQLAEKTAERVLTGGQVVRLYHLNPKQRRWVHMALAEKDEVETQSVDEGETRCLVVMPAGMEIPLEEEPPLPEEDGVEVLEKQAEMEAEAKTKETKKEESSLVDREAKEKREKKKETERVSASEEKEDELEIEV